MRNTLILLAASTALSACATAGAGPGEKQEQVATVATAAEGPVAARPAPKPQIGSFGFDEAGMDRRHVQGKLTMGDNVADLAGLSLARDAWLASLGGKDPGVIGGFTGDQRFYLGWAQVWRRNYREANLRQRLLTDPHSPSEQRTAVVRNMDPWYPAFEVKPGQRLYLAPEQRVRIW